MTTETQVRRQNQASVAATAEYFFTIQTVDGDTIFTYFDDVVNVGGFTVNLNPDQTTNPGGSVVFDAQPPVPANITIERTEDLTQLVDYQPGGPFPSETHEGALDKLTRITQQNEDLIDRAIIAAPSDDGTTSYLMPSYNAGKAWMWSEDNPPRLINSDTNFNSLATDAAASAAAAAVSETNAAVSAASADTSLKDFETQYLGSFASDPALDNEGNALIDGALYWNTGSNIIRVYSLSGGMWVTFGTTAGIDDTATSTQISITDTEVTFTNDVDIETNKRIMFGSLDESFILHNSTSMVINSEVGDMFIQNFGAGSFINILTKDSGTTTGTAMTIGGTTQAVMLNYDFVPRFETTVVGANVMAETTGAAVLGVGVGRTGDGLSILNLVGDATYTVYGFRLLRLNGPDAGSQIRHRGLGGLDLITEEAAPINFFTSGTIKAYFDSDGGFVEGTPTGLSQGPGSGNFESLYIQGVMLSTAGFFFRGALANSPANQSLATGVYVALLHSGSNSYDTDSILHVGGSLLVVPAGVTRVKLRGKIKFAANSTGTREARWYKNGSQSYVGFTEVVESAPSAGISATYISTPVLNVVAGDDFELQARQDSGGNLNLMGSAAGTDSWLSMEIVQ